MKIRILLIIVALLGLSPHAQGETQRGFVLPVEFGQGFRSVDATNIKVYLASLQATPSYGLAGNKLLVGGTLSGMFMNPSVDFFAGPRVAVRVFQKNTEYGSIFNLQLTAGHLWGTGKQKAWNAGALLDLGPMLFSVSAYREAEAKDFWIQGSVGINLDVFFPKDEGDPFTSK